MKINYPEHEKLKAVQKESQAIGEFLDWLTGEKKIELAKWNEDERVEDRLLPWHHSTEKLLADYFKIDLVKLEAEKRKMLAELRE